MFDIVIDKMWVSNENSNFERLESATMSFIVSQHFCWDWWCINECDSLLFYKENVLTFRRFEELNQYFPNNPSMIVQNCAECRSIKVQDRTMDFNVREYEVYWYGLRFDIATNF